MTAIFTFWWHYLLCEKLFSFKLPNMTNNIMFLCRYFEPSPKFFFIDDINGIICRMILPPNAPFRRVESLPCASKDEAKRNVCLKACKELHEKGALTDYLLPGLSSGKKNGSTAHHSGCNSNEGWLICGLKLFKLLC